MTLAEVIEKAKNDPEFRKGLVGFAKDTDEGKEVLENFAKMKLEDEIKAKVSEIHKRYDDDILEVLGVRKKGDQKTYDFVKELLAEYKKVKDTGGDDKDKKVKELQEELKKLQDSGEFNKHWKETYEQALAKWEEKEKELTEAVKSKDTEFFKAQVVSDLTTGRSGLKFNDAIPQVAIDAIIKEHERTILDKAKMVDGKVVYVKEDGTQWMNGEFKPISSSEIWAEKLKDLLSSGNSGSGGNAETKITNPIVKVGEGDNATTKLVLDKAKFSTKMEFQREIEKVLSAQAVPMGSKEWNELSDSAYKEYEVDKMELQ